MSYREDQHLRAVATEAGRADLVEAMDRADAELSAAAAETQEAYRRWQDLSRAQDSKAGVGRDIRRQIRAIGEAAISEEKS